jgi:hypothetical protein
MIRAFQLLGAALIAVAIFFLIRADLDDAFVTGVLGLCSFFLSIRFKLKPQIEERQAARLYEGEVDEIGDTSDIGATTGTKQ